MTGGRRVVVTGIGAVTPLGNDAASTWESLVAGRSGVRGLTTFDASTFPVRIAGQVSGFSRSDLPDAHAAEVRHLSRAGMFGVAAALEAVRSAGVTAGTHDPAECGIAMGGTVGRIELEELFEVGVTRQGSGGGAIYRHAPHDVLRRDQNVPVAAMARVTGFSGPMIGVSTACAGSGHAIGEAFRHVQDGDATVMVAGGFDSLLTWMDLLGFSMLGALTDAYNDAPQRASRPFDLHRSGFVLGEGAVAVVLEEREAALARGATVLAELTGYASTLNAYRITDSPPDGGGAVPAMAGALADAGLTPADVDYVVAHGTSTPGNDASETAAIKAVFGPDASRLVISSPKSLAGHLTSAAAALNLLAAVGALRYGVVPPTVNLDTPDPKLDLDYVPHVARRMPVRTALVNAFAFGGTNTSLAVTAHEEQR